MKPRETTLGPPVIGWLRDQQFTVYQEVVGPRGRADLVATCGPQVIVVELKVQLSWELLWQAHRWRDCAHQVWVGVPSAKNSEGRRMAEMVYGRYGVGILTVHPDGHWEPVTETRAPSFNRRADVSRLRADLRPEQQDGIEAGTNRGGHFTAFKGTCAALRAHVEANPGALFGDTIKAITHHYASDAGARSRLSDLIQRGIVPGLRVGRDGRALRLYADMRDAVADGAHAVTI